jgi:hypothetical protein
MAPLGFSPVVPAQAGLAYEIESPMTAELGNATKAAASGRRYPPLPGDLDIIGSHE